MFSHQINIVNKIHRVFSRCAGRAWLALPLVACLSLLLTASAGNDFISRKISGTSPAFMDISYFQFEFSPDGETVVFIADRATDNKFELYSVPVTRSTPTLISGPISLASGDVWDFIITPDGNHVVYLANPTTATQINLYCVPIGGGTPVQLNLPFHDHAGIDQNSLIISPDGHYVVYKGDQVTNGKYELFSVPINTSCQAVNLPVRLNDPVVEGGIIDMWDISPNSQRVVYRADATEIGRPELYSVPINRSIPDTVTRLNDPLVEDGYVSVFSIASNSQKVVYSAVQETAGVAELYSVAIDGVGSITKLNPDISAGHRGVLRFAITPNSAGVVYIADQDTLNVDELYSVAITGGTVTKLNGALADGGKVTDFQITPNNLGVVFTAEQDAVDYMDLFSRGITGGPLHRLDPPDAWGDTYSFEITPNNLGVVFMWKPPGEFGFKLYSNWITGGVPINLSENLASDRTVDHFEITPDSLRAIYRADLDSLGVDELYSVSTLGGTPEKLNRLPVSGGNVEYFRINPDSQKVIFKGDLDTNDKFELYMSVKASHAYLPAVRK